jgi:RNA polymerase sigma factor (sigma-70 family)
MAPDRRSMDDELAADLGSWWREGLPEALIERAWQQAQGERWPATRAAFAAALARSLERAFTAQRPTPADRDRFVDTLHLADLALAVACAEGVESAWEQFMHDYRPALYRAAEAIDRDGGRDLADSLVGELFGLRVGDELRQSPFRSFHGRCSLLGWTRAVLAQRHVDRLRAAKRLKPLPEDGQIDGTWARPAASEDLPRFQQAMLAALSAAVLALAPRDRLRLACYYAQEMTLKAIGVLLEEHEATVSRHLSRTRGDVRRAIERHLRDVAGFDANDVAACVRAVAEDSGALDLTVLLAARPGKKLLSHRS